MSITRFLLVAGAVLFAAPAFAQTYYRAYEPRDGYVEYMITDERYREPVYDLRDEPRVYAPPRTLRRVYPDTESRRRDDRMNQNPYIRRVEPRDTRRVAPQAPAAQRRAIPDQYRKQTVVYDGAEKPGTIVIETKTRFLYLVQGDGTALRYGVGVGRDGFNWTGTHKVTNKKEWPDWRPPAEMRARRPDLPVHMAGGPNNPLGARALYLGSTLYRIHGSNEPWTIGQAVSSGCFRMTNEDVEDLYERVPVGATVKVI